MLDHKLVLKKLDTKLILTKNICDEKKNKVRLTLLNMIEKTKKFIRKGSSCPKKSKLKNRVMKMRTR